MKLTYKKDSDYNFKDETKNNQLDRNSLIRTRIKNAFSLSEEVFLKQYYCERETLFKICLPYFQSSERSKEEKKFISLYLCQIKNFIILLKSPSIDKFLNSLNYVAENLIYQEICKNKLIMKYGDKADNFYITLSGLVSILIPIKTTMLLNLNEYNRFIALLLLYKEFELMRILLKENKSEFSLDIPDIKFILYYLNKNTQGKLKIKKRKKKIATDYNKYSKNYQLAFRRYSVNIEDEDLTEEEKLEKYNTHVLETFMYNNLTQEEFSKFSNMKNSINFEENSTENIDPENYIKRLKNFKMEDLTDNNLIKRFLRFERLYGESYKKKHPVMIYEYREIVKLKSGDTFGDVTMHGGAVKRTATIITLTQSYFGCLDKEVFTIVKENSEKKRKEKIQFLCNIKLFKTINIKSMTEKYINLFAFKEAILNEHIIKNGEINNYIIIIKSGIFEVNFTGTIQDIFHLISYYIDNYNQKFTEKESKKFKLNSNILMKIDKLIENKQKIITLLDSENNKNNNNDNIHKLFILNNLAIFGLKETEQKKYNEKKEIEEFLSFFDIKCNSIEGEYALLDKKIFYKQIYGVDYRIKEETMAFIKDFMENTLTRIAHVLYYKIWNLLNENEMKIYKYIKKSTLAGNDNEDNNNLITDVGLDFDYMEKYNLSKIEYIINKIFDKYSNDAFEYKDKNFDMFNFLEKERKINKEKNEIKLEEEKCNKNKFISLLSDIHKKQNKFHSTLNNFKSTLKDGKISLLKNVKLFKQSHYTQEHITNDNDSTKNLNNNIINYNNYNNESKINLIRKNMLTPKRIKVSLKRCPSSYYGNGDRYKKLKILKFKKNDFIRRNSSYTHTRNSSAKKFDFSYSMKIPSNNSKLRIKDSLYSSHGDINRAYISKINLSLVKYEYESTGEQNIMLSYNQKFKKKYNYNYSPLDINKIKKRIGMGVWPNSVKNTNNSNLSFYDSTQISKESYVEKRKLYILKNTRDYFTKNKNVVLSKIVKKKEDKMV